MRNDINLRQCFDVVNFEVQLNPVCKGPDSKGTPPITEAIIWAREIFFVANKRLYNRVCPSVGPSVTRFFQTAEFKPKIDLTSINAPAQRSRLLAGLSALFKKT